jgi:hypothetical protein
MPTVVSAVGAAIYLHADYETRRSAARIEELRRQEAESAELGMPTREASPASLTEIAALFRLFVEQEEQRARRETAPALKLTRSVISESVRNFSADLP